MNTETQPPVAVASSEGLCLLPDSACRAYGCLSEGGRYTADQMRAYAAAAVAAERERCYEMVADEQLYPSNPDAAIVNPGIHRAMRRIEAGTTLDDLLREVQSRPNELNSPAPKAARSDA